MLPKSWLDAGSFFKYKNHQIFYRIEGEGTPLLLIHGFPTSSWDWYKIWDDLKKDYKLYTLDMIRYGFSDKPTGYHYSFADQADLWEVFCKENNIKEAHILAHDYGDTVVQEMLARFNIGSYFLDIKTVTLLNGGILQGGYNPRLIQRILASSIGPYVYHFVNKGSLRRNFTAIFGENKASEEEIDTFWSLIDHKNGKRVMPYVIRYLHERENNKVRYEAALRNCPVPLHLINGVLDPISGQNIVNLFRKKIPNGKVTELTTVGHYPQTEAPQEVLKHFRNGVK